MAAVYNPYNSCATFTTDDFEKMANYLHEHITNNITYNKYSTNELYTRGIESYLRDRCVPLEKNRPFMITLDDKPIGLDYIDYIINNDIMMVICYPSETSERKIKNLLKKANCSAACLLNKNVICGTTTYDANKSSGQDNYLVKVIKL